MAMTKGKVRPRPAQDGAEGDPKYVSYARLGLNGRLGNALYELGATAGIAALMGLPARFNADWIHRPYFSVPDEVFGDTFVDGIPADKTHLVHHMDPRARPYLQDWNLFPLPTFTEWLRPSPLALDIMEAHTEEFRRLPRPILSVHVRRGDNAPGGDPGTPNKHLYHPMPSLDYYQKAINQLRPDAASVAVFSDDPVWCTRMLPGLDYYHHGITRPKEHEADFLTAPVLDWIDWQMQRDCELHVCSNSTFGMTAAIAAGDWGAVVPWPVFGPKLKYIDATLLFPHTWTRLPSGVPEIATNEAP